MTSLKWFASLFFAATVVTALDAETGCPGNVASLPFRLVNRYHMIVAVSVNRSGPYHFLLDTGMQVTMVDPSLAAELHLEPSGTVVVAGAASRQSASYVQADLLEAGSQAIANQRMLAYDVHNLGGTLDIKGVLGEDFLEHFDVLIDNVHKLLCLDTSRAMRAGMRGPHTALIPPSEASGGSELPNMGIIEARLSDAKRPVRLVLDSGANGAILYNASEYLAEPPTGHLTGADVEGVRVFTALPAQDVKIGSVRLPGVLFVSLAGTQKDARTKGFDGVLTLGLFRRVFICHAQKFVVLEP